MPDLTTNSAAYQDVKVYHEMPRTKNKAVSEGNGPIPQDKSGFDDSRWLKYTGLYTVALWKIGEICMVGSSTVFQTVRYMVSEFTVSDGTFAHTTVFQMVFGYGIPTLR